MTSVYISIAALVYGKALAKTTSFMDYLEMLAIKTAHSIFFAHYRNHSACCRMAALLLLATLACQAVNAQALEARDIIHAAINAWRGTSSDSTIVMTIHRPDWERSMTLRGWTQGDKKSIVRVIEPKKDAGNGTLLLDKNMWTYTPKINRIIKIPSSMMAQSWMGSDFTNKDIARSDAIIDDYTHRLLKQSQDQGHTLYIIESIPKESAAVVWGKEVLTIRDDNIVMKQEYYDQAGVKVKQLITSKTGTMDNRPIAIIQRMVNLIEKDEWTQIEVKRAKYNIQLSDQVFTLSNLRNPR